MTTNKALLPAHLRDISDAALEICRSWHSYYETTDKDPRHVTRERIRELVATWIDRNDATVASRYERSFVSQIRAWLDRGVDDVDSEDDPVVLAVELFERRCGFLGSVNLPVTVAEIASAHDETYCNHDFWLRFASTDVRTIVHAVNLAGRMVRAVGERVRYQNTSIDLDSLVAESIFARWYADQFAPSLSSDWQERLRADDDGFRMFCGGHRAPDRLRVLGLAGLTSDVADACADTGWDP